MHCAAVRLGSAGCRCQPHDTAPRCQTNLGNLPQVHNMDVQYGQSAIFTPADFAFPTNSIKAEATANTEMTVIADLDMELLMELHEIGSVTNLKDRRTDLYEIVVKSRPDGAAAAATDAAEAEVVKRTG